MKSSVRRLTLIVCSVLIVVILSLTFLLRRATVAVATPTQAQPASLLTATPLTGFPATESLKTIDFSSPTVIDLDGDGQNEILVGDNSGCVWGWNERGEVLPGYPLMTLSDCTQSARIRSSIAIGDIDGDGDDEIVAGTRGVSNNVGQRGKVFAWHHNGTPVQGWPIEMDWLLQHADGRAEIYSVALANVVGDDALEVIAGTSNNASDTNNLTLNTQNLYVWYGNGDIVPGYPTWYRTAGIFGAVGAGDVSGGHHAEVFVGRDHIYMHGYDSVGNYLTDDWPIRTYVDPENNVWGQDLYLEFTSNGPSIGDLDGDGDVEIVIVGKVRNPLLEHSVVSAGMLVLQADGSRRPGWVAAAMVGPDLTAGMFRPGQHPALADLDGDGSLEIIVTFSDGTARAFHHDGRQMWSFDFAQGRTLAGGEPVVGNVIGGSAPEVVFGTYSPDDSAEDQVGIYVLDANGQLMPGYPMPLESEHLGDKKGVRNAPTIADVDCDGDSDLAVASRAGVLYVWEMGSDFDPANNPWPTGRHDVQRSGSYDGAQTRRTQPLPVRPRFSAESMTFFPIVANPMSCLAYFS